MALTTEDRVKLLTNKVLCANANGDKILLTGVDFVTRTFKDEGESFMLELSGMANAYLNNPRNPDEGATEIPDNPEPVVLGHNVDKDPEIFLNNLSRALGLKDDEKLSNADGEWLDYFDESNEKSVVKLLKEKGMFIKTTLKANWEKAMKYNEAPFYFNPMSANDREPVTADKIAAIKAKLKAKTAGAGEALAGIA